MARLIEKAIQLVRPHAETRSVSVQTQIQSEIQSCVDGKRLGSAIFNLILNACQAAARVPCGHREVVIAVSDEVENVFVRVIDNGAGVPIEIRDDLFQPFIRAGKNRGMGLGLAIARRVAQEHGGDVYLELSCPGKTVFVLKVPKRQPSHGSPTIPALRVSSIEAA